MSSNPCSCVYDILKIEKNTSKTRLYVDTLIRRYLRVTQLLEPHLTYSPLARDAYTLIYGAYIDLISFIFREEFGADHFYVKVHDESTCDLYRKAISYMKAILGSKWSTLQRVNIGSYLTEADLRIKNHWHPFKDEFYVRRKNNNSSKASPKSKSDQHNTEILSQMFSKMFI